MAEFVDVLRQFDRMCKANAGCSNCPLHEQDGVSDRCSIGAFVNDSERIEREVMAWAAEHPEPVYELWGEWFEKRGDLIRGWHNATNIQWIAKTFGRLMCTPIPAEIAQKLGLKPKE
jgi:hypothetical protein